MRRLKPEENVMKDRTRTVYGAMFALGSMLAVTACGSGTGTTWGSTGNGTPALTCVHVQIAWPAHGDVLKAERAPC